MWWIEPKNVHYRIYNYIYLTLIGFYKDAEHKNSPNDISIIWPTPFFLPCPVLCGIQWLEYVSSGGSGDVLGSWGDSQDMSQD